MRNDESHIIRQAASRRLTGGSAPGIVSSLQKIKSSHCRREIPIGENMQFLYKPGNPIHLVHLRILTSQHKRCQRNYLARHMFRSALHNHATGDAGPRESLRCYGLDIEWSKRSQRHHRYYPPYPNLHWSLHEPRNGTCRSYVRIK